MGELLRSAREAAGLSGRGAAKAASISETRWRQLESGVNDGRPTSAPLATLRSAAQAVGADVADVLRAAGFGEPEDWEPAPPPRIRQLDVSDLTPMQVAQVRGYIAGLKDGGINSPGCQREPSSAKPTLKTGRPV